MATALELMNRVLLNIGENEVLTDTNPIGKKAFLALKSALLSVAELHDWPHLWSTISGGSFTGGLATFGVTVQDVRSVRLPPTCLQEVTYGTMLSYLNTATPTVATPQYWSDFGDSRVQVYPIPTNTDAAALRYDVLLRQPLPALSSSTITTPVDFEECVVLYAEYLMHLKHTGDAQAASGTRAEFEQKLHYLRQRKSVGSPYILV